MTQNLSHKYDIKSANWLKLSDVAAMTCGGLLGEEVLVGAVSIDTRNVNPDDLFIAIKGEKFDGHDFVADLEGKVAAALVSKEVDCDVPQVLVEDTKLALATLAAAWRKQFKNPVIGLTGSNGKTTLKEMVAAILGQQGEVLATVGNFNNDIGLPLTLLRIRENHDFAVIEMGANHFGEIDFLTDVTQPDVAVINNAGPAHLEGFGDVEGVARAKGEIFNSLTEKGVAVINADDDYADYWSNLNAKDDRKVISFGMSSGVTGVKSDVDISGTYLGEGRLLIRVNSSEQLEPLEQPLEQEMQLNLLGKHNAMNALAATAVVSALGLRGSIGVVDLEVIKKALESLNNVPGRLTRVEGLAGITLLDDTYNANPGSVNAAIDVLAESSGTRILVLGDMGELGGDEDKIHADVGTKAKLSGIEKIFGLGKYSAKACEAFGSPEHAYDELEALVEALKKVIHEESNDSMNASENNKLTMLIKGSRTAKMERVIEGLRDALKVTGGAA